MAVEKLFERFRRKPKVGELVGLSPRERRNLDKLLRQVETEVLKLNDPWPDVSFAQLQKYAWLIVRRMKFERTGRVRISEEWLVRQSQESLKKLLKTPMTGNIKLDKKTILERLKLFPEVSAVVVPIRQGEKRVNLSNFLAAVDGIRTTEDLKKLLVDTFWLEVQED